MNINCTAWYRFIAAACGGRAPSFYLGVCALGMSLVASAGGPRFITFDAPGAGAGPFQGTGCAATDCSVLINDWGEVTGYYLDAQNVYHAFVRSPEGKFVTFEAPGADTTPQSFNGTVANGINDAGAITGFYVDASGNDYGYVREPAGAFTIFQVPGSTAGTTVPIALNLEGAVVGYYLDQNGVFYSFLRNPDGSFKTWSGPDQCETSPSTTNCYGGGALGVNALGTVSGHYSDSSGNFSQHGLIRSRDGRLTAYEVPGAGTGFFQGTGCPGCLSPVNLFGTIAGLYVDANYVAHGYLRSPSGTYTTFDVPGSGPQGIGCFSDCFLGLNDWGAITGFYVDASNVNHGFLRSPEGKITSFDPPGSTGTFPVSINDAGVVTGFYLDSNNVNHGFVLLPDGDDGRD